VPEMGPAPTHRPWDPTASAQMIQNNFPNGIVASARE